jgi:chromosome partitioning protein
MLGCRVAEGISERVVFRELFPRGLTALDDLDRRTLGVEPTASHAAAREEIRRLIETLNLPAIRDRRPASASEEAEPPRLHGDA